jgi:hypothetical protein
VLQGTRKKDVKPSNDGIVFGTKDVGFTHILLWALRCFPNTYLCSQGGCLSGVELPALLLKCHVSRNVGSGCSTDRPPTDTVPVHVFSNRAMQWKLQGSFQLCNMRL